MSSMEIVRKDGKYYFSDGGHLFKMKGINHFTNHPGVDKFTRIDDYYEFCNKRYSCEEEWARDNEALLKSIGFNTIGAFSKNCKGELYKTNIIYLSDNDPCSAKPGSDFFSKEWRAFVEQKVREQLPGKSIVYIENEMKIGGDWRSLSYTIAHGYLNMGPACQGKKSVIRFVRHILHDRLYIWNMAAMKTFRTWNEALECTNYKHIFFLKGLIIGFIMRKFYRTCKNVIKALDSHVLIGGSRLISWFTPPDALRACAKYSDFVSVNYYWARFYLHNIIPLFFGDVLPAGGLKRFYKIAGKPLYITEFGFVAENGYNGNKNPFIYKTYRNQKYRAKALERYLRSVDRSWIIGLDVFEFVDQPANGRDQGDSEDNNFGIISRDGKVYEEFSSVLSSFFSNF